MIGKSHDFLISFLGLEDVLRTKKPNYVLIPLNYEELHVSRPTGRSN